MERRWPARDKQRRTPHKGTRRAANWRQIHVGSRIVNKYGELTDWVVLSEPFRPDRSWIFLYVDVECLGCGHIVEKRLTDIVQGQTKPLYSLLQSVPDAGLDPALAGQAQLLESVSRAATEACGGVSSNAPTSLRSVCFGLAKDQNGGNS